MKIGKPIITRLGDITSHISSGSTPRGGQSVYLNEGPVMLVRSQNVRMNGLDLGDVAFISEVINAEMKRSVVEPEDVLLNITGASIGRVARFALRDVRANVNQHVCIIRPKKDRLDSRFLTYFLSSSQVQHDINYRHQHGGTRQALTFAQIAEFPIPLPPLSEQKRIADILDKADAIRRKRQEAIEDLSAYIPSLFIELFGEPEANPKQWEVVPISHFVQGLEGGKNFKTDDKPSAETRYMILKVSAVTWGKYRAHESKPVPPAFNPPKDYFVRPGDLLMSRANTRELIGAAVYVDQTPTNIILPDKIWRFVWKTPSKVEPLFVHSLLRHPSIQGEMGRRSSGTSGSMKNIAKPKVLSIPVPLPPLGLQQDFAAQVRYVRQTQTKAQQLQNETTDLFNSLVQRAFKGEL